MLFFLAGLAGVPQELLDAAKIDGANAMQRFLRVTLPLLGPTLTSSCHRGAQRPDPGGSCHRHDAGWTVGQQRRCCCTTSTNRRIRTTTSAWLRPRLSSVSASCSCSPSYHCERWSAGSTMRRDPILLLLCAAALLWAIPFAWMAVASLRPGDAGAADIVSLFPAGPFSLGNFADAWSSGISRLVPQHHPAVWRHPRGPVRHHQPGGLCVRALTLSLSRDAVPPVPAATHAGAADPDLYRT